MERKNLEAQFTECFGFIEVKLSAWQLENIFLRMREAFRKIELMESELFDFREADRKRKLQEEENRLSTIVLRESDLDNDEIFKRIKRASRCHKNRYMAFKILKGER